MNNNIEGVVVSPLKTYITEDGYFREIVRDEAKLLRKFGQSSVSLTHPGSIKAFHYHKKQDDLWYFPLGRARVVLFDLRKKSKTYKKTQVVMMGQEDPKTLLIPKGVAHGFQVLGKDDALLFYHTTHHYNPRDEYRISHDDAEIGFDWTIKHG